MLDTSNLCSDNSTEGLASCPLSLCSDNRIAEFLKCEFECDKPQGDQSNGDKPKGDKSRRHLVIIIVATTGCGVVGLAMLYYLARTIRENAGSRRMRPFLQDGREFGPLALL